MSPNQQPFESTRNARKSFIVIVLCFLVGLILLSSVYFGGHILARAVQGRIKPIDNSNESLARKEAEKMFFQSYLARADSYVAMSVPRKMAETILGKSQLFFECKKLNVMVNGSVNEADRLNGIQWAGTVIFETDLWRLHSPVNEEGPSLALSGMSVHQGWNPWQSYHRKLAKYDLIRTNNRWEIKVIYSPAIPLSQESGDLIFPAVLPTINQIPK